MTLAFVWINLVFSQIITSEYKSTGTPPYRTPRIHYNGNEPLLVFLWYQVCGWPIEGQRETQSCMSKFVFKAWYALVRINVIFLGGLLHSVSLVRMLLHWADLVSSYQITSLFCCTLKTIHRFEMHSIYNFYWPKEHCSIKPWSLPFLTHNFKCEIFNLIHFNEWLNWYCALGLVLSDIFGCHNYWHNIKHCVLMKSGWYLFGGSIQSCSPLETQATFPLHTLALH